MAPIRRVLIAHFRSFGDSDTTKLLRTTTQKNGINEHHSHKAGSPSDLITCRDRLLLLVPEEVHRIVQFLIVFGSDIILPMVLQDTRESMSHSEEDKHATTNMQNGLAIFILFSCPGNTQIITYAKVFSAELICEMQSTTNAQKYFQAN